MQWEMVIGLEVHVQLSTDSKIFSGAATAYGAEPNTQACAVDLGLPGVLPVLNQQAVNKALQFGLAVDAHINQTSVFARKNYFYPDSPKGYQISQFELPIVGEGYLDIRLSDGSSKRIGITRAHLEEDAGKSIHENLNGKTGIDLNRAGTPLLEIVSEPDMRSAEEAVAYLKVLHHLVRYLGISDGNMQEGSFRCDVNLSLRPLGQQEFGTRTECKNINSFRFVEQAIHYEYERQMTLLEAGQEVIQETRLFDPDKNETRSMRSKEDAHDYRYFPDPDLLPVVVSDQQLQTIKVALPELPAAKQHRFINELGIKADDAALLMQQAEIADYFEQVAKQSGNAKAAANWVIGEILPLDQHNVSVKALATLIQRIDDNTLSSRTAKTVFAELVTGTEDVDAIIDAKGLKQISDSSELEKLVKDVITNNPAQVEQFKAGKGKVMGFFVGQIMKATQGKANPAQVNQLLQKLLQN